MHAFGCHLRTGGRPVPLTIVVADDDLDYRLIVRHILASASDTMAIVGEAADGEDALVIVLRERPDIVITDLVMPRLNGAELARRIKQELPQTKVILISSHTEDAYRLMASDSGADAFVSKQVIDRSLLPAIRDVIARRPCGGSGPLPPSAGAP
jgi:DNA-binding NarL/FixJ family response regulator